MTLSASTIEQVVRYLAKIEFIEIKLTEVRYDPPVLTSTIEDQIRSIDSQIGEARRLSGLESWTRDHYESVVNPLKFQMYSLIQQNSKIIASNDALISVARAEYESRCVPIRNNLSTARNNFIIYLKSVATEVQS